MFQSMIQGAIQSTLKQFIKNLEKTDFSLWGGTLDLKNIMLNEEAVDKLVGLGNMNLRLSTSFIDKVTVQFPVIDFIARPHLNIKANSLYATLTMVHGTDKQAQSTSTERESGTPKKVLSVASTPEDQQGMLQSLQLKIAKNINIQLKKAKIILFSDIHGSQFDLVLKIKDVTIINNKQSPMVQEIAGLEEDADFQACNMCLNIGKMSVVYYESSHKKTDKFTILAKHSNMRLYNFNSSPVPGQGFFNRTLISFREQLEIRVNKLIYKRVILLAGFLGNRERVLKLADGGEGTQVKPIRQMKYETEIKLETIQMHIVDDINYQNLRYIADVKHFKLILSSFAQVYNQSFSLGSVMFRYHHPEDGQIHSLLSVLTSNLVKFEIHVNHDKLELSLMAQDIFVKLFNLEQSSRFLHEIHHLQLVEVKTLMDEMLEWERLSFTDLSKPQTSEESFALSGESMVQFESPRGSVSRRREEEQKVEPAQQQSPGMPKLKIDVKMLEIELSSLESDEASRLLIRIDQVKGEENKSQRVTEIGFRNLHVESYEHVLIDRFNARYQYSEANQLVEMSKLHLQIDLPKLNQLFIQRNLLQDIHIFLGILTLMASRPKPNQEVQSSGTFRAQINGIELRIGYERERFVQMLNIKIDEPKFQQSIGTQNFAFTFHISSHLIERLTLSKLVLLEKAKISLTQNVEDHLKALHIEANNLRVQIYPETIIELRRFSNILEYIPPLQKLTISNKTMKIVTLIEPAMTFLTLQPGESHANSDLIDLTWPTLTIKLQHSQYEAEYHDPSAIKAYEFHEAFSLWDVYQEWQKCRAQPEKKFFTKALVNLEKRVQILVFIDCSNFETLQITILERYSIVNMAIPECMSVKYGKEWQTAAAKLDTCETIQDLINAMPTSFSDLKQAKISINEQQYSLNDLYEERLANQITLPFQIYSIPQSQSSQQFEIIALRPFVTLKNGFSQQPMNAQLAYRSTEGKIKKGQVVLDPLRSSAFVFSSGNSKKSLSYPLQQSMRIDTIMKIEGKRVFQGAFSLQDIEQSATLVTAYTKTIPSRQTVFKVQSYQGFTNSAYQFEEMGLIKVTESTQTVPIQITILPRLKLRNNCSESLYIRCLAVNDEEKDLTSSVVMGNSELELCTDSKIIHYFQIGLHLGAKLVYSRNIAFIKTSTEYVTITDGELAVYVKVNVSSHKQESTQITIEPAFIIVRPEFKQMTHCQQEFIHYARSWIIQPLTTDGLLLRTSLFPNQSQQLIQSDSIPDNARDMWSFLMLRARMHVIIKASHLDSEQVATVIENERSLASQIYENGRDQLLQGQVLCPDIDLAYANGRFELHIAQIEKCLLQIVNNTKTCIKLQGEFEIVSGDSLNLSEELFIKQHIPGWELTAQRGLTQVKMSIDPRLLLGQDETIVHQSESLTVRYLKLTKKRVALIFQDIDEGFIDKSTKFCFNLEIQATLLPFQFLKEQAQQSQVIKLRVLDGILEHKVQQNGMQEIEFDCEQVIADNIYENNAFKLTRMPIINIDEGFLIKIALEQVTKDTQIVKSLGVDFREEGKFVVNIDESLKNLLVGFGTYLKSKNAQTISSKSQRSHQLVVQDFSMNQVSLLVSINLSSKVNLQIENAQIDFESLELSKLYLSGDILYFLGLSLNHVTKTVFHSLHRILYHSNFLGKIPSILDGAKRDFTTALSSTYRVFTMFPLMNIAAKGMFQFMYNLTSSIGGNFLRVTLGQAILTPLSEVEVFYQYLAQCSQNGGSLTLGAMNESKLEALNYKSGGPVKEYIDEALLLEVPGVGPNVHLAINEKSISLCFMVSKDSQLKIISVPYHKMKRAQIVRNEDTKMAKVMFALSKKAVAKLLDNEISLMNNCLEIELSEHHAKTIANVLIFENSMQVIC